MKRVLVVGTGPCGFAVLNSLENLNEVWVMDGQAEFNNSRVSTNKHLALKMKFGSSHTYIDSSSVGIEDDPKYKLPISYSRGGFGEVWGNGFTPYKFEELMPGSTPSFQIEIRRAMKELLDMIPFSHVPSQLDNRFGGVDSWSYSKVYGNLIPHPFFANIINKRESTDIDALLFGQPSLLLDSSRCTNCGLCLTGCPYGALFDPGEHINRMVYSKKLDSQRFIKGILKKIVPEKIGVTVHFISNNEEQSAWFDEVILSTGPLSTALILMNSKLLPDKFEIPDSQVFYGAFLSRKRIKVTKSSKEVGQLVCYPMKSSIEDFQVSLYAPSEISRQRISQTVLPQLLQIIKLPRFLSERIIPAIGFLPQEVSGKLSILKTDVGFEIIRQRNKISRRASRIALKKVSKALRTFGLINFAPGTQIPIPGSGFHIGGSLPLGGEHVDEAGYLVNAKAIRVLDASILPNIPAGAHTFLTMALIRALLRVDR